MNGNVSNVRIMKIVNVTCHNLFKGILVIIKHHWNSVQISQLKAVFLPPKCTCSFPKWPPVSVRVAIKINGFNCGSVSPLCSPPCWPSSLSLSCSLPGCGQNASWWRRNTPSPTHSSSTACSWPLWSSLPSAWTPLRRGEQQEENCPCC